MMTFEERITQPVEDPFAHHQDAERFDAASLDYGYSRQQVLDLLKRTILDPENQPRWVDNQYQAYWVRPITGHHFVAYHILLHKPWDHGLATPSPRFMTYYSPMGSLRRRVEFLLSQIIAEDIMKHQVGVDCVPRLATTPDSIRVREACRKIAKAATRHAEVVAWVLSKIPNDRGQYHLGLSLDN